MRINCPTCQVEVRWSDTSPWRPFCSARCKAIDLGDWASDRFVIAGNDLADASAGTLSAPGDLQQ
jgi:endogenous inhibitor of DNA gyrase (YacG/DUF329 family)